MESRPLLGRPPARRGRFTGLALTAFSLVAALVYVAAPLAGRGFIRVIELVVAGCVWVATSIAVGVSMWDVVRTIGRAALGSLVTLGGSIALSILVVVGVLSLYCLQRLLESEGESS